MKNIIRLIFICVASLNIACNESSIEKASENPDKIEKLDLFGQNLDSLSSEIGKFVNLTHLYLNSNNLKILPNQIANLKKLKVLNLNSNQLTKFPDAIAKLENLESLSLINNQILTVPDDISNLKKLKYLNLSNNPISWEEQKKLQKLLPNTEIHFEFASQLKNPEYYHVKALEEYQKNNFKIALDYCNKTIEYSNKIGEIYSLRGYLRLIEQDTSGACNDWQAAIQLGDKQAADFSKKFCKSK